MRSSLLASWDRYHGKGNMKQKITDYLDEICYGVTYRDSFAGETSVTRLESA